MGLSSKARSSGESWGLGLLLVLFLDDDEEDTQNRKKKKNLSINNSSNSQSFSLINKAQFTISLCGLIVVFTILLFTLCTSDPPPTTSLSPLRGAGIPRRWLKENSTKSKKSSNTNYFSRSALQGMGTLFRRGTRAMSELVVAHLTEDTSSDDLRWFLRTLHLSGLTTTADLVLIFPSSLLAQSSSIKIITQENHSFKLLLFARADKNGSFSSSFKKRPTPTSSTKETIWGRGIGHRSKYEDEEDGYGFSWGSIVGFEAAELDPEDSLSGFLHPVPMQLRRWACYQMLLGRLRRSFNHILLIGINDAMILGDALSRVRNRTSEAIHLWGVDNDARGQGSSTSTSTSDSDSDTRNGNAAIIMGGIRGVRRLSNAMLTETVRVAMRRKKKPPYLDESMLLTHLLGNNSVLNNKVTMTTESIPGSNSIVYPTSSTDSISISLFSSNYMALIRGRGANGNLNLTSFLRRQTCSSRIDSSVYMDC
eukprot:TRINITY_DN264_c0_g1_i1.p1 TRINITY_DN264_c0_g1~~TRINITY_DN264_c0_g1_i1.p1  ORF type:complete len:480 (+),score=49.83 TRINITY_DN264_c0_g1_i1:163-1602(+)